MSGHIIIPSLFSGTDYRMELGIFSVSHKLREKSLGLLKAFELNYLPPTSEFIWICYSRNDFTRSVIVRTFVNRYQSTLNSRELQQAESGIKLVDNGCR